MIADLKPYLYYKASSQAWLGEVPGHWSLLPNRALFVEVKDRNHPDEEMLSVTITRGIVRQKALLAGSSKKDSSNLDKSAYKLVQPCDIAYNKMRAWQGAIAASALRGIISPAYVVMRLRNADDLPSYFHHLYRTPQFAKEAERWSYGITSDMWSLRPEHFKMIYTPEPPPAEQAAIVRFLDWANGRLERAIRAKRKVVALLNEQKQAIIYRAVTRGLDPSVPLKPSGISWLGDIPQHWEVRPVKHWAKINTRTLGQATDRNYQFRYIDIGAVGTGYLVRDPEPMQFAKAPSRARRVLQLGDTIVSTVRTYLKAVWFVGTDAQDLIASTGFAVFSPNPEVEPEYLHYLLQDSSFVDQVTAHSIGIAYPAIAETVLARFRVALPSSRNEQRVLIATIKRDTEPVRDAISRLEREIDLLREYRARLVADVVTGKLDVREAAAQVPIEAAPDIANDDADLGEAADEEATA